MELSHDEFMEYVAGLDDDALEDMRHSLRLIDREWQRRRLNANLASVATELCPDADADVFAEALFAVCAAQHELSGRYNFDDAVVAAVDIADARAGAKDG